MHCLWLVRTDPGAKDNGESLYSAGLIESMSAAGAEVEVMCLSSGPPNGPRPAVARLVWHPVTGSESPRWRSILSALPHVAHRCATPEMRKAMGVLMNGGAWDAVVIDGLSMGWAAGIMPADGRRPRTVHVSHNHEESTRVAVADNLPNTSPYKLLAMADARKARRLERMLADTVDLVTAITPADRDLFASTRNGRPILVLPPGYSGRRVAARAVTAALPRRATIIGSYGWIAKQLNLREFLDVAVPIFARAGVEIRVVGGGDPAFLARIRRRFSSVTITGRVSDLAPELQAARIAVVPERLGGGFKTKLPELVFNRVPIAAHWNALGGIPLGAGKSVLAYPDYASLAHGVVSAIDDFDRLNRLQESAYAACAALFDWDTRGRALLSAISSR
jgi:glycosyltransferase involved in cell wall biosynthesis